MNPENNNPLSTPSSSGMGTSEFPGMDGLSANDNLASAADNLTSAGLAVGSGDGIMGIDQLSSVRPEAIMAPPEEEPLIPAAPVPGSIGSAISAPAAPNPADAIPPVPPMATNATPGVAPAPEAAPANHVPYNPFATPAPSSSTAAPASNPAPAMPNPTPAAAAVPNPSAFQPAVPPKAKPPILTIILGAATGVLAIATIVFLALFINAKNHTKTVYLPDPNTSSASSVEVLTCSRAEDFGWLIGEGYSAPGTRTLEMNYTNNLLRGLSSTSTAQFASEEEAATAEANLEAQQADLMGTIGNSFVAEGHVVNGLMTYTVNSNNDSFSQTDAAMYLHGLEGRYMSTSLDVVRTIYEEAGFSCSTSN